MGELRPFKAIRYSSPELLAACPNRKSFDGNLVVP